MRSNGRVQHGDMTHSQTFKSRALCIPYQSPGYRVFYTIQECYQAVRIIVFGQLEHSVVGISLSLHPQHSHSKHMQDIKRAKATADSLPRPGLERHSDKLTPQSLCLWSELQRRHSSCNPQLITEVRSQSHIKRYEKRSKNKEISCTKTEQKNVLRSENLRLLGTHHRTSFICSHQHIIVNSAKLTFPSSKMT